MQPTKIIDMYRKQADLTIEQLCASAGMSADTYARRMRNPDALTIGEIKRLLNAMHIKQQTLINHLGGKYHV